MKRLSNAKALLVIAAVGLLPVGVPIAAELPDKLISKGGIIYPRTGDFSQERFQTPPNATDLFRPGMLLGVLPDDCVEAAGPEGAFYRCDYDLALKPDVHNGHPVYRVIDAR